MTTRTILQTSAMLLLRAALAVAGPCGPGQVPVGNTCMNTARVAVKDASGNLPIGTTVLPPDCTLLVGAKQLCAKQAPYYASGSAATTTTVGTTSALATVVTVADGSTFRAGQGVYIAGAGTSGANYIGTVSALVGGVLTITPAIGTTVAEGAKVQHDESAGVQAAMNAQSPGWTIYFPDGYYRFNGALQDVGGANAILVFPSVQYGGETGARSPDQTIVIAGLTPAAFSFPHTAAKTPHTSGVILQTDGTSGSLFGAYNAQSTFTGFSRIWPVFRNLTLRSYDNPQITMLNCGLCTDLTVSNVTVDTGATAAPVQPTSTNGRGIVMPGNNNNGQSIVKETVISGYYYGLSISEHGYMENVSLVTNKYALAIANGGYPVAGVNLLLHWNQNNIAPLGTTPAPIDLRGLRLERETGGTWNYTNCDIADPSNYLTGTIRYGETTSAILICGGKKLRAELIWRTPWTALTDTPYLAWDAGNEPMPTAKVTIAGDRLLNMTNVVTGARGKLRVTQGGSGSYKLLLPDKSYVRGGGDIPLTATVGATDVVWFDYDGTSFYWDYALAHGATATLINDLLHDTSMRGWWTAGMIRTAFYDATVTVTAGAGGVTITPKTATAGNHYGGWVTSNSYNMTGRSAQVKAPQVLKAADGNLSTRLEWGIDTDNWVGLSVAGTDLKFSEAVSGTISTIATAAYTRTGDVDAAMLYWRLRESAGTIYADYSANATDWTNLGSTAVTWAITACKVSFNAGTLGSQATPGTAIFENFILQQVP